MNESFQKLLGEVPDVVPVCVLVVARGMGVGAAPVFGDLLHQMALYESVLRVSQRAGEDANHIRMPARLLYELLDVLSGLYPAFIGVLSRSG